MSDLREQIESISKALGDKAKDFEEGAVYAYIQAQAKFLTDRGKDLTEYELVRNAGNYDLDGSTVRGNIKYGLVHKSKIKDIHYSEE